MATNIQIPKNSTNRTTATIEEDKTGLCINIDLNSKEVELKAGFENVTTVGVNDIIVNGESVVQGGIAEITIPTKLSELDNDEEFVTLSQVTDLIAEERNQRIAQDLVLEREIEDKQNKLKMGSGLSLVDDELSLRIDNLPEIDPRNLSIGEQEHLKIYIFDDDTLKQASLNDLDYSKITVQQTGDLSKVRTGDFVFAKGG